MNENAMQFVYRNYASNHKWVFTVHECGIVEAEAFLGSLRTRRFQTDVADAQTRIAALKARGYVQKFGGSR